MAPQFTMKIPVLLLLGVILSPQALEAASTVSHLKAGQPAPEATVRTDAGEAVPLLRMLAGKPTVLIFYRGGWCPFCTRHLAALGEAEADLRAAGFQLLALGADRPDKLRARPTHEKLPFTLLSDSEMHAAKAFGIAFKMEDALVARYKERHQLDLEEQSGQTHHLLPHPAVFIVDSRGIIRFAHVNPDYKARLTPEEILKAGRAAVSPSPAR